MIKLIQRKLGVINLKKSRTILAWKQLFHVPWGEHEAAKSGEKEPGLKSRVEKIDSLEIVDDGGRNRVVKRSEGGDSGEILALFDVGVDVKNGKRAFLKLREYLVFQVFVHPVNAHISS